MMPNRKCSPSPSVPPISFASRSRISCFVSFFSLCLLLASCSVERHIPADGLYLKRVKVESTVPQATKDLALDDYVQQTPNKKWFVAKVPLAIYTLSKPGSDKSSSRLLRKLGEAPVIYDTLKTRRTLDDMTQVMVNAGYLHSSVAVKQKVKGKKLTLTYIARPGQRYRIHSVRRQVDDDALRQILCGKDTARSLLQTGMSFDINRLNDERSRINTLLRRIGYFQFNKDYISFVADTLAGSNEVDLSMHVRLQLADGSSLPEPHTQFRIGHVNFYADVLPDTPPSDSIRHQGSTIYFNDHLRFRPNLLTSNTLIKSGELYNESHQQRTYTNLMRLQAIALSRITYHQRPATDTIDCNIILSHARPHSLSLDLEGTNSAGDLGVAASASVQHKNLFRGSETLTLKLRGAYEAITGLDDYDGNSYTEIGGEVRLGFPGFLLPFVPKEFGATHDATSEISLQYNLQNRPEFRRRVLTAAWRYRWQSHSQRVQHKFDLLEVNYIYMPWISRQFREHYLDSLGRENAILRYNYENLLITKLGYTYNYNSLGSAATTTYGKNAYTVKFNVETSGNALYALTRLAHGKKNDRDQYTFCGIAYAQYVKGDFDFAKSVQIDRNNSVALHAAFGIAVPYGNSDLLPFEKRYFAGGANSVRGWSVRSLGPGAYDGADRQINFLNQSGDVKLDLNLEYRAFLFWKLNGAVFIDAGNIWTIKKYDDQPGGEFRLDKFFQQIAASYGLGLRLNLDFFTVRFDAGMKAVNPVHPSGRGHWPILHPNLSRDFAFHFAVGLPF